MVVSRGYCTGEVAGHVEGCMEFRVRLSLYKTGDSLDEYLRYSPLHLHSTSGPHLLYSSTSTPCLGKECPSSNPQLRFLKDILRSRNSPLHAFLARGRSHGQVWGLELTSASRAGFLVQLTTVIVPVLEAFLGRRRLKPQVSKRTSSPEKERLAPFDAPADSVLSGVLDTAMARVATRGWRCVGFFEGMMTVVSHHKPLGKRCRLDYERVLQKSEVSQRAQRYTAYLPTGLPGVYVERFVVSSSEPEVILFRCSLTLPGIHF